METKPTQKEKKFEKVVEWSKDIEDVNSGSEFFVIILLSILLAPILMLYLWFDNLITIWKKNRRVYWREMRNGK